MINYTPPVNNYTPNELAEMRKMYRTAKRKFVERYVAHNIGSAHPSAVVKEALEAWAAIERAFENE